ncbi:MAG TPA: hypothetical protein VFO17_09545 [Acidimicrobiia bacterium]|nr:hypothetical protein [Acidimicrobiia bacterium]
MILAHGIGGRTDLPIPIAALIAGAATVLVLTFVTLNFLWTTPRLQDGPRYQGDGVSMPTRGLLATLGLLGLFLVIGQVVPPLLGAETESVRPTIAPVLVWVVFWLVVPFVSALVGNWYTDINPWRSMAGAFGLGRMERIGLPATVGVWPAAFLFVAFTWLELVYPRSGDPVVLGTAALVYTVGLLVAMALVGRETGLAVFDLFTPYNRLISAISPLGRNPAGRVVWRGWLRSLTVLPEWPGLWFFTVAMIGTVSFDGITGTAWFRSITGPLGDTMTARTLLLVGTVVIVALGYLGACALAAALSDGRWSTVRVAQRFAHTLVPIGLAYAAAHYITLILFEGQQFLAAVSDPFGMGGDLFGTADNRVVFFIRSSTPIWLLQVAFIVGGHLVGVVLAHDRSLQDFGRRAVRSQYAMLGLMIALTSLGLLILSG